MSNSILRPGILIFFSLIFISLVIPPVHTEYDWAVIGGTQNSEFGFWLDGNGDVNGDGFADVIIGAPSYDYALVGEGAVFIYFGSPSGLSDEPDWVMYGEQDSSGYGRCVSIAGDVNADGYDDVLIGSHQVHQTKVNEGKVYLYLGGPDGPSTTPVWTMVSGRKGAKLGEAVVIAGDLNSDGYDDICVGAHGWDDTEVLGDFGNKAGKFWIFNGNPAGVNAVPFMTCVGVVEDANLGVSMDQAGDVNGDGTDDLHVGGYIFLIGDGMICTFQGEAGYGPDMIPDFMAIGGAMDTSFYAINLSQAGDINGDGYDDVVIGAPRYDANGIYQSGKLHLHYGSSEGLQDEIAWTGTGTQYDERWAFNVNQGGDINNDGYDDLLVGAKYFDNGALVNAGKAELFLGGPGGLQRNPAWTYMGTDSAMSVGTNLCNAGDVNGDGYDDLLVSGDEYSGDLNRQGIVYLFYGQPQACDPPQHPSILSLTPNTVRVGWNWLYGAQKYKFYMKRVDAVGTTYNFVTTDSTVYMGGLVPGAHYVCYVSARCDAGWTGKSVYLEFTTPVLREGDIEEMKVFPTLVEQQISIYTGSAKGDLLCNIIDASGRVVLSKNLTVSDENATISITEVGDLPSGNYFLAIESGGFRKIIQFVKQ